MRIRVVAPWPAEQAVAATRRCFFRESQESHLSFWQGIADGRGRTAREPGDFPALGRGASRRPSRDTLPCPAAVRTLGAPPRSAWPTEGLPCHNTGGGAPEGGVPRAGPVSCCRWQRLPSP